MRRTTAILILGLAAAARPCAAADPAAGKAVFNRCRICHTVEAGGRNGAGPESARAVRAQGGQLEGFAYSEAMKNSGIVWDEATLEKYLHSPKQSIPGNENGVPGHPERHGNRRPARLSPRSDAMSPAAEHG